MSVVQRSADGPTEKCRFRKRKTVRKVRVCFAKVQQACEQTKEQLEKAKKRMTNLQNIVETQKSEIKKLETTIQEAEAEKRNQRKELEGVARGGA